MTIRYEREGKVAIFTLDNPSVNALTPPMHKQFHNLLLEFNADRDIHVGRRILTGAGTRAFCGGGRHQDGLGPQTLYRRISRRTSGHPAGTRTAGRMGSGGCPGSAAQADYRGDKRPGDGPGPDVYFVPHRYPDRDAAC